MVGGVGDYTACLARALHLQGVQVSVLTSTKAQQSVGAFPFPVIAGVKKWGHSTFYNPWPYGQAWRLVHGQSPDIVHIQYQAAAYALLPAINGLPFVLNRFSPLIKTMVTFHDLRVPFVFRGAGRLGLRDRMVRWMAEWSQAVACTDEADLQVVTRWGLRSPARLIPIGSNIPAEARWTGGEQGADGVTLGYFGLLNQSKGVEILLEAYHLVRQRGLRGTLAMIGADLGDSDPTNAEYARHIRSLATELGVEKGINWTGRLPSPDTSRALAGLDVCILPYLDGASFRRGTLMAALAHGLPIVTTMPSSRAGIGPRLIDGQNCRLAKAGDAEALANAIMELASSPAMRQRLAQGAQALSTNFSWEEIGRKTAEAYGELLGQ